MHHSFLEFPCVGDKRALRVSKLVSNWIVAQMLYSTPPKTNMEPENQPL